MTGDFPRHEGNVLLTVGIFFLISNAFERLAYYSLTGQMSYIYTAIFGNSGSTASKMQSVFQTIAYIAPLAGAVLADKFIGRYKTILSSYPPYIIGASLAALSQLLAATTWKTPTKGQTATMSAFFTLGTSAGIAIGAGFMKPNLIVLGADQFDPEDEEQKKQQSLYFSAYYWATNVAAFCAFYFMSILAVNGVGELRRAKHKNLRVLLVALMTVFFICCSATSSFLMKTKIHAPEPRGSMLLHFFGAVYESWTTSVYSMMIVGGTVGYTLGIVVGIVGLFVDTTSVPTYMAAGLIFLSSIFYAVGSPNSDWIENSSSENGGSYDPELIIGFKAIISILRFIPYSIIFWVVYNSLNTFFFIHGCVMKTQVFEWYNVPSSQLPAWDSLIIVIFVPLHQKYIYPLLGKLGFEMTLLRQSGYGLMWTAIAMFSAAFLELIRKNTPLTSSQSSCYDASIQIIYERDLNIMALAVGYTAVAFAEIGYAIACYEFYYSQVPASVRSVVQSLNMFTTSLGTMAGGVILAIFEDWVPDNLDAGHIEYLYLVIGSLATLNLAIFTLVSMRYTYSDFSSRDIAIVSGEDAGDEKN